MRSLQFLCLLLGAFVFACDDNSEENAGTPPASGLWQIHYFQDDSERSSSYKGYTFEFLNTGKLQALKSGRLETGSWSTTCDDSKSKLCIEFSKSAPNELLELVEDWKIIRQTEDFLHLEDVNSKGEKTIVHFVK
jgi:hypothetical protein